MTDLRAQLEMTADQLITMPEGRSHAHQVAFRLARVTVDAVKVRVVRMRKALCAGCYDDVHRDGLVDCDAADFWELQRDLELLRLSLSAPGQEGIRADISEQEMPSRVWSARDIPRCPCGTRWMPDHRNGQWGCPVCRRVLAAPQEPT